MINIKYVENDSKEFVEELGYNLHKYNQNNCEYIRNNSTDRHNYKKNINIAVYDGDKLIGGASGWIQYNWYYLDQLWLDKKYRKFKLGSEIMTRVETICRKENCVGIKTETWGFQARGFYEKNGFVVYGELKDFPPGTTEYYLMKLF